MVSVGKLMVASVAIAAGVFFVSSFALADCAWILWAKGKKITARGIQADKWEIQGAYPTSPNGYTLCQEGARQLAENFARVSESEKRPSQMVGGGYVVSAKIKDEVYMFEYQCFPDTVKP